MLTLQTLSPCCYFLFSQQMSPRLSLRRTKTCLVSGISDNLVPLEIKMTPFQHGKLEQTKGVNASEVNKYPWYETLFRTTNTCLWESRFRSGQVSNERNRSGCELWVNVSWTDNKNTDTRHRVVLGWWCSRKNFDLQYTRSCPQSPHAHIEEDMFRGHSSQCNDFAAPRCFLNGAVLAH